MKFRHIETQLLADAGLEPLFFQVLRAYNPGTPATLGPGVYHQLAEASRPLDRPLTWLEIRVYGSVSEGVSELRRPILAGRSL